MSLVVLFFGTWSTNTGKLKLDPAEPSFLPREGVISCKGDRSSGDRCSSEVSCVLTPLVLLIILGKMPDGTFSLSTTGPLLLAAKPVRAEADSGVRKGMMPRSVNAVREAPLLACRGLTFSLSSPREELGGVASEVEAWAPASEASLLSIPSRV